MQEAAREAREAQEAAQEAQEAAQEAQEAPQAAKDEMAMLKAQLEQMKNLSINDNNNTPQKKQEPKKFLYVENTQVQLEVKKRTKNILSFVV
jgi:hypothetical protein